MIEVRGLNFTYPKSPEPTLWGMDFTVGGGEIFGFRSPGAKAFWVSCEHGVWWPYLLAGFSYNLAVAWLLFRRFLAKHT